MPNQIRISPELMEARAAEFQKHADEVTQLVSELDTLFENLQSEWEGQASESFATQALLNVMVL